VFGGLMDFTALDTIERYDAFLDHWKTLELKVPLKIAKVGVSIFEPNKSIIICGGIFSDENEEFSYINTVYKLDFDAEKWIKMASMHESRVLYSVMPRTQDRVYAIGGSFEGKCEYIDISSQKWVEISDYSHILPDNDIQTFALINSFS
jgi:N-acetylneuraminic acid mutarotase